MPSECKNMKYHKQVHNSHPNLLLISHWGIVFAHLPSFSQCFVGQWNLPGWVCTQRRTFWRPQISQYLKTIARFCCVVSENSKSCSCKLFFKTAALYPRFPCRKSHSFCSYWAHILQEDSSLQLVRSTHKWYSIRCIPNVLISIVIVV
jgi:hypothetical protein